MYFVVQAQVRLSTLTAMVSELEEKDRQLATLGQWVTDQRTQVSVSSNSHLLYFIYCSILNYLTYSLQVGPGRIYGVLLSAWAVEKR